MLRYAIQVLLNKRWNPEQVAHEFRIRFAGRPSRCVCTEAIYQAIYDSAVDLTRPARRRRRVRGDQRRGRLTAMRMICERPVDVEDRVQAGHWEGDLITGPADLFASPTGVTGLC